MRACASITECASANSGPSLSYSVRYSEFSLHFLCRSASLVIAVISSQMRANRVRMADGRAQSSLSTASFRVSTVQVIGKQYMANVGSRLTLASNSHFGFSSRVAFRRAWCAERQAEWVIVSDQLGPWRVRRFLDGALDSKGLSVAAMKPLREASCITAAWRLRG